MKDILVDQDGEFRCPDCHGRNFDRKRTLKGKVGLGVVVLPAAALSPKRMKCLQCGTYSKTGNAQRWRDTPPAPKRSVMPLAPDLTVPAGAVTVRVNALTANSTVPAVVASKLTAVPGLSLAQRKEVATQLIAGERPLLIETTPEAAVALVELLATRGVRAQMSDPAATVQP